MAFVSLTKPRVMELLLTTTAPTMVLAAGGLPSLWLVASTLAGGALAAGGAAALNCYLDRDIDRVMHRTEQRPLVTGEVSDREALVFGTTLSVVASVWLALAVNWLAGALTAAAILFYVFVYTLVLKRRTPQNIVWGGAAGCMPVLIGWSAVTGSLSWAPVVLFGVIFFWTPPHYWPLSIRYRQDYHEAGVPMLPVVRGGGVVTTQIVLYAWATVACSLLLVPVAGMGWVYGVGAALAGGWFLAECHGLHRRVLTQGAGGQGAMRVFHGSIGYLSVLFVLVAADPFLRF